MDRIPKGKNMKIGSSFPEILLISITMTDGKLFRNSDYFKVRDGKIGEYECFFGPGINYPDSEK
jgi:5-methylcytosine-specific restriction endonuclease McrBC GTP-binding regulatory subunit McrB